MTEVLKIFFFIIYIFLRFKPLEWNIYFTLTGQDQRTNVLISMLFIGKTKQILWWKSLHKRTTNWIIFATIRSLYFALYYCFIQLYVFVWKNIDVPKNRTNSLKAETWRIFFGPPNLISNMLHNSTKRISYDTYSKKQSNQKWSWCQMSFLLCNHRW